MAIKRNRRLRKKLHLAEFQELGFSVSFDFAKGTDIQVIDQTLDDFIAEVIDKNGLAYDGSGYLHWEGLVCLQQIGKCSEQHRELVTEWLTTKKLENIQVSPLFDVWWEDVTTESATA
jgi:uncharacterized protein